MNQAKSKKSFPYERIFFYFSVIVLLGVAGSFFYFSYSSQKMEEEVVVLEEDLAKQKTPQQAILEQEVLSNQRRMQDFPVMLSAHRVGSEFFRKLESLMHPNIVLSEVKASPVVGDATIAGTADNFESLAQQLAIFSEAEGFANSIDLSKMILNSEGRVDFAFSISLEPQLLSF
jgi:hypothetical protein